MRTCAPAAAELIDVGEGLEVSISWALTRPANEEHNEQRATVTFEPPDAPVLREAAQILRAHSRFPGHALTPTGVMAIRCKQFHLPDL